MTPTLSIPHHMRATLVLGLPLMGSHLATAVVGITDTIMLGWYGVSELAAAVVASMIFYTFLMFGSGFSAAALPKVAAAQGDPVRVRRITRMTLWIGLAFAALTYPVFFFSEPILLALGQDAVVASGGQTYLRIAGLGIFPAMIVVGLRSHLSGLERTSVVLWATLLGAAVNVALNYVLIFGHFGAPEMGLAGAALASLSVHGIMAVVLCVYAVRGPDMAQYQLFTRLWRPDWPEAREILVLGWPISLTLVAESGLFTATSIMVGWLGPVPLAAHGIAIQITSATFMVHMGLAAAVTVRTGAAFGRGDVRALRKGAWAGVALAAIAVGLTVALFLGVPGLLVRAFIDPTDPAFAEILSLGVILLAVAALFQVADAAQVLALGLLRGLQDTRIPMYFALLGYWVIGIPAGWFMGMQMGLGAPGVWLGLALGLSIAGGLMMRRFWRSDVVRAG